MRAPIHLSLALAWLPTLACGDDGGSGTGSAGGTDGASTTGSGAETVGSGATDGGESTGATEATSGEVPCEPVVARAVGMVAETAVGPVLVAAEDGYGMAWVDSRDGDPEVYFARLDQAGEQIGGDVRLSAAGGISAEPTMVWTGDAFAIAWSDDLDGNREIYFTRLDADGTELGDDVRVTTDPERSEVPSLVWTGDGFGLAWNDTRDGTFQIYFAALDSEGAKVGDDLRVSAGETLSASPSIAASDDGFGVAWHDTRDGMGLQVYFATLDSGGERLYEVRLSDPADGTGGNPKVLWDGSRFATAWTGNPGAGGEIQLARAEADGMPIAAPIEITATDATAGGFSLATHEGGFVLAWSDRREGDAEVRVVELDSSGGATIPEIRISDDSADSASPSLASRDGRHAVAWIDVAGEMVGTPTFAAVCP